MTYRSTTEALLTRIRSLEEHGGCERCAARAGKQKALRAHLASIGKGTLFILTASVTMIVLGFVIFFIMIACSGPWGIGAT